MDDQLTLIDQTYKTANGEKFSISTLTNPFGYNTTWAYLYSWYGKKKYGYIPHFFGPDQNGIFAGELMSRIDKPQSLHFRIIEPKEGLNNEVYNQSIQEGYLNYGRPISKHKYGAMELDEFHN